MTDIGQGNIFEDGKQHLGKRKKTMPRLGKISKY